MYEHYTNDDYYENFLFGLKEPNITIVKDFLKKIDYNLIKNDISKQCIAPVISHIVKKILNPKETFQFFIKNPDSRKKVFDIINITEIISELDVLYVEFLPITKIYIPLLDMQAELILLYCNNYIHKLIKDLKQYE